MDKDDDEDEDAGSAKGESSKMDEGKDKGDECVSMVFCLLCPGMPWLNNSHLQ